jgi:hypothetical protein
MTIKYKEPPMGEWWSRSSWPWPYQEYNPFGDDDVIVEIQGHSGPVKTVRAGDVFWGRDEDGEGTIVAARRAPAADKEARIRALLVERATDEAVSFVYELTPDLPHGLRIEVCNELREKIEKSARSIERQLLLAEEEPAADARVAYTMDTLDEAIKRVICWDRCVLADHFEYFMNELGRVRLHERAVIQAFVHGTGSEEDHAILKQAKRDLASKGQYCPKDQ